MTRTQWAILAALGLAVVALFCIGGALILTTLSATPKPPEEVRVIEVTATPVPVIAPATAKPIPTVQPTAQIQPPALNIFATQTAIAPTPTSTSTPNVTLTGNPEQWLPSPGDMPAGIDLVTREEMTQESTARQYPNPAEVLAMLQKYGRFTGISYTYANKQGCNLKTGTRGVITQITTIGSRTNAIEYFNWWKKANESVFSKIDPYNAVGENAMVTWQDLMSDCPTPDKLRIGAIRFQRFNVLSAFNVITVSSTMADTDVLSLALRLAKITDAKIIAAGK